MNKVLLSTEFSIEVLTGSLKCLAEEINMTINPDKLLLDGNIICLRSPKGETFRLRAEEDDVKELFHLLSDNIVEEIEFIKF